MENDNQVTNNYYAPVPPSSSAPLDNTMPNSSNKLIEYGLLFVGLMGLTSFLTGSPYLLAVSSVIIIGIAIYSLFNGGLIKNNQITVASSPNSTVQKKPASIWRKIAVIMLIVLGGLMLVQYLGGIILLIFLVVFGGGDVGS